MASSDARPIPRKNVAYRVTFPLLDADGDLVTGAGSLDSEVSKDGGTFADCTNEATEIATNSGMYYLDLTSTEMNADTVAVIVKSADAKTTPIVLYPEEAGDVRIDPQTIWDALTSALSTSGSIGKRLADNIDAVLSTRSSHSASDVWGVATRTLSAFGFSVTVGTNGDKTGYSLSSAGIQAIWDALTSALTTVSSIGKLLVDNINATISSRLASGSYTAPDNSSVAAIKTKTDALPAAPAATGDIPTAAQNAAAVWDLTTTGHASSGTFGEQVKTDVDAILQDTAALPDNGALTTMAANIAAILLDTGTDGVALSAATKQAIADEILKRGVDNVEDAAGELTLAGVILGNFRAERVGTTLTIYKSDGTVFATMELTVGDADPVTGVTEA